MPTLHIAAKCRARLRLSTTRHRAITRAALTGARLATATLALAGCKDAVRAFGTSPAAARSHAEEFLSAATAPFTDPQRNARYDLARRSLARSALTPSRVFDDTAVWTALNGPATRTLLVAGDLFDGHYRLDAVPAAGYPAHPGDSRHSVNLTKLDPRTYTWDTNVEFGIGSTTAADVGRVLTGIFGAAEGRTERDLRAEYRDAFPRAAASFGRLFSVDTLRPVRLVDGSTMVTASITVHPAGVAQRYPAFAQFAVKYLLTPKYHLVLTDGTGAPWFDINSQNGPVAVRFRVIRGHLAPLGGAVRPLPDSLHLHADISVRIRMFTVGARNLDADFLVTDTPHERAWTMVFRREPEWDLPLASEHVIRSSLHKPFEGTGVIFRLGVRDDEGVSQTLLTRYTHFTVQESKVVKFLGGLGAHAASEATGQSEREEDAFLREGLDALRVDVRTLLGPLP